MLEQDVLQMNLEPGQIFGHYKIISILGSGSMGTVYKAHDLKLERIVAVKTFQVAKNFDKEAKAMALFDHPHIIKVFEVGSTPAPYIAMEYVQGMTLKEWSMRLATARKPELEKERLIVTVFIQLAEALQEVHKHRMEHLDIKPGNIIMGKNNIAKLMDFGIAHSEKDFRAGTIAGTPNYMAPEQAQGNPTLKSDIYALGATMYEVITGYPPFRGDSAMNIIFQLMKSEPSTVREINQMATLDIEAICLKCLNKRPDSRYASAKQLTRDLQNYLQHKPLLARKIGKMGRAWRAVKRNKTVFTVMGIIIALVIIFIVIANFLLSEKNYELDEKNRELEKKDAIHYCDRGLNQKKFAEEAFNNNQDPTYFYKRAISDYQQSIKIAENVGFQYAKPFNNIGNLLNTDDNEKKIIYNKILEELHLNKITSYYLERAINIDNHYTEAYFNLGLFYEKNNDIENAIKKYAEATNCDFSQSSTYQADLKLEENPKNEKETRTWSEYSEKKAQAYFNRGHMYEKQNELDKALDDYDSAIKINKKYAKAYFKKGKIYEKQNKEDKAIDEYTKAIMYAPNDYDTYINRGNIYLRQNQLSKALDDYKQYTLLNDKNPDIYFNCATIYRQQNQLDKAIIEYKKLLEIAPNYDKAEQIRNIIKNNKK